jgi:cold shock CspA family protein
MGGSADGTAIVEMRGGDWKLFHWHVSTVEGDRSELGVGQRVSTEISKDGKTALDVKFSVAKKVTK